MPAIPFDGSRLATVAYGERYYFVLVLIPLPKDYKDATSFLAEIAGAYSAPSLKGRTFRKTDRDTVSEALKAAGYRSDNLVISGGWCGIRETGPVAIGAPGAVATPPLPSAPAPLPASPGAGSNTAHGASPGCGDGGIDKIDLDCYAGDKLACTIVARFPKNPPLRWELQPVGKNVWVPCPSARLAYALPEIRAVTGKEEGEALDPGEYQDLAGVSYRLVRGAYTVEFTNAAGALIARVPAADPTESNLRAMFGALIATGPKPPKP